MTSAVPSDFRLTGCRQAADQGLQHVRRQIEALERAVAEEPGLAFDLARLLVESACRTILSERGGGNWKNHDLPKLFRETTSRISFVPANAEADPAAQQGLKKTLQGLGTAIHGICELRNHCGFASHGKEEASPQLEAVQALLAASAADAIVGFLYRSHRQESGFAPALLKYEELESFNCWIDDAHEILRVFGFEFRPSEVLFHLDPAGYRNQLAEYEAGNENG